MSLNKTRLLLGLGFRSRNGKDESAQTILRERGHLLNIERISFADALKQEVNDAVDDLVQSQVVSDPQHALIMLCSQWETRYDPYAVPDDRCPYGKQVPLLQAVGEGRRKQDPDYWLDKWKTSVAKSNADVIVCADMRYVNEADYIKSTGGHTIKVTRLGFDGVDPKVKAHISENALNDYDFDYNITAKDGQLEWLRRQAVNLFDYLTEAL